VPSDDGLGFHNAQGGAPIGPNSGEPDPNESVAKSQSQATVLVHALQHKKLMTECQVLRVQSGPSLKTARRERSREARSTNIPLHPTTPRRKLNAFNENGLPGRDTSIGGETSDKVRE